MEDLADKSQSKRSLVVLTSLIGATTGGLAGAIGGLTGIMRFEDAVRPWEHALALGWSLAIYGGVFGCIIGLVLKLLGRK